MNQLPQCMVCLPADHRLMADHGHWVPFLILGDTYAQAGIGARVRAHPKNPYKQTRTGT